jgi:HSP20 family protein
MTEASEMVMNEEAAVETEQHPVPEFRPAADIFETLETYGISVSLPGVQESDLTVRVENGVLEVRAPVTVCAPDGYRLLHRGFVGGAFRRGFRIPGDADVSGIKASLKLGVLRVVLPKKPEARPRNIELSAEV